ncbi:peptidase M23-like protein [Flavobacterium sp. 90]|uniref:M23 family metallopeptidase n=1 Tax=unclassified Flavobacterium TaxID=196869 RepID=UPI000EB4D62E|nr:MULTISPECIES: M23 family metallopeptidase [unclassified Flavobacterium]RKR11878.1 peptidase M23-like protein [Flavobacterium sp. 81]TCK55652.1 peptidase M23-like protein [Flavobacterium sp. 90]
MKLIKATAYTFTFTLILLLISCADTLIGDDGKLDEDIYLNYKTKTTLELPFDGEWYIVAGGKTLEQNHHFAPHRHQRYALDIVQVINGKGFSGDGTKNEDHYCFGKRLNAPGDGKIVAVVNNIEDNVPGVLNSKQAWGNYIIIDHLNGEFSCMVHFKKGSIIVKEGDNVVRGQMVGQVGNSGNSTGPHLHYHLQTTASSSTGVGLPMQFLNYYADTIFKERGEPVTGQRIKKE